MLHVFCLIVFISPIVLIIEHIQSIIILLKKLDKLAIK